VAINLRNTSDVHTNGLKVCVYGQSASGKTTLISTAPNPIIISAESGLLSLANFNIPYIEINNINDLAEAYKWATSSAEAASFETIALDSISECAEVILSNEKKTSKDARMAYGNMADQVIELIKAFRDISGKHVYFSAKIERTQDETGKILWGPSMPGNKLGQQLPYLFDEIFALRVASNADGEVERALQTGPDSTYVAKDRSGKLDAWEAPDWGLIINKITGQKS